MTIRNNEIRNNAPVSDEVVKQKPSQATISLTAVPINFAILSLEQLIRFDDSWAGQ
jgi:hypothetical protein